MADEIRSLSAYVVDVPLKKPVRTAHGVFERQRSVVVRIELSDETVGWGEVDPVPGFSTVSAEAICASIAAMAHKFVDVELAAQDAWSERLRSIAHGRQAVEMAILDAAAKNSGKPLGAYLGTPARERIELSGWIGWEEPSKAGEMADDWRRRGFAGVKVKIGSGHDTDVARVAAVREAIGDAGRLIVDAGEAYDADAAVELLKQLAPYNVAACEQPVPGEDLRSLAEIRRRTGVPLILDESVGSIEELERAVAADAVDLIKLKMVKHDGVLAALALGHAANERGVQCTVGHGFALGLTTLAEGHIASILPNFCPLGEMVGPLKMVCDVALPAPDLESGVLTLPDAPGLGAEADQFRLLAAESR